MYLEKDDNLKFMMILESGPKLIQKPKHTNSQHALLLPRVSRTFVGLARARSNGIDIKVSRHHTVSPYRYQTFKVSKYRLTTEWFIFNFIPGYQG